MSHYSQIILVLALTLSTTFLSSTADTQLIIDTCMKIAQAMPSLGGNYKICVDFLQSDPRSATATLEGLGEIAFELTQKKTVAVESQVKNLSTDPKTDPKIKKVLADCAEIYSEAEDSTEDGLKTFRKKDYFSANIQASAAFDAPSTCEDGFKDLTLTSPLTQVNNEIQKFYGIILVFTTMFHK